MTDAARWREAAQLGARGEYSRAWSTLDSLSEASGAWPSLALSMRGSHLRQVGEVVAARECDARAHGLAVDAESRADAGIGRAADDIAAGDVSNAGLTLQAALPDAVTGWRTATRWHWVRAELLLLQGDPTTALDEVMRAIALCEDQSERHLAKSRIMADAARGAAGQAGVGDDLLRAARAVRAHGWATLQWPLALVVADLRERDCASARLAQEAEGLIAEGAAAVRVIAEGLPEDLRPRWQDGPAARRLLRGGE